ncbi:MAG TPA: NAD(P)-dependent alcohol dehydrogenase [Saprospiraceae bacterium]|nr:NAD(P)-dependent alcohol dehydrogenase [Saprospiraceae bacterium]
MIACFQPKYGTPNDLIIKEVPIPEPNSNEILVKILARTVNRTDTGVQSGKPFVVRFFFGFWHPSNEISGTDFSGVIVKKGESVTTFEVGDEVYGFYDIGLKTHAQYACIDTKRTIFKKPAFLSHEMAAASCEGAHYAYYFMDKVKVDPSKKILVNGGTGAIGSAMTQMLVDKGCEVTVVCAHGYEKTMKAWGVNKVYNFANKDFLKDESRYHYIFDCVGKSTYFECKHLLVKGGVYISSELGPWSQNLFLSLLTPLLPGKKVKFPLPLDSKKSLTYVQDLLVRGKFKPLLDRAYELSNIKEAFEYALTGQKKGNVIIKS